MISKLKGIISSFDHRSVIVDVNNVGYRVFANSDLQKKAASGKIIEVWIHFVARDNAMELYGFENREGLDFFEMLISVSGIGPKTALNILNLAPIQAIKDAVGSGDVNHLTKVSGIGRKNAEKIVLELKDKLGENKEQADLQGDIDSLEALKSLGYSTQEAREALKKVPEEVKGTSEKLKRALKILSR